MQSLVTPHEAALILARGDLVALPTETVYGLAARADQPQAVARMYAAKGRPANHPVIVHVESADAIESYVVNPPQYALTLAKTFWPGPMTLVLNRSELIGDFITGGQDTVGLRVPNHPLFLATLTELARLTGVNDIGLAAPSANRFGRVSPTTAAHVIEEFADVLGDEDGVLDGGATHVGVESTIIDCTGDVPHILRSGAITVDDVERVTGLTVATKLSVTRAPGTLASHYAPNARVIIATESAAAPECAQLLTHGDRVGLLALARVATPPNVVRLADPGTATEYAAALYAALREADALDLTVVVAVPPAGNDGLEPAILDRLTRAAHQ